jgi:hypothetical protein
MAYGELTSTLLVELAQKAPFKTYDELEKANRKVCGRHASELPAHYSSRDFLEFIFSKGIIKQGPRGFRFKPGVLVSAKLEQVKPETETPSF